MTTATMTAADRLAYGAAYHAALAAVVEAPEATDLVKLRVELGRKLRAGRSSTIALAVEDVFAGRPPGV